VAGPHAVRLTDNNAAITGPVSTLAWRRDHHRARTCTGPNAARHLTAVPLLPVLCRVTVARPSYHPPGYPPQRDMRPALAGWSSKDLDRIGPVGIGPGRLATIERLVYVVAKTLRRKPKLAH